MIDFKSIESFIAAGLFEGTRHKLTGEYDAVQEREPLMEELMSEKFFFVSVYNEILHNHADDDMLLLDIFLAAEYTRSDIIYAEKFLRSIKPSQVGNLTAEDLSIYKTRVAIVYNLALTYFIERSICKGYTTGPYTEYYMVTHDDMYALYGDRFLDGKKSELENLKELIVAIWFEFPDRITPHDKTIRLNTLEAIPYFEVEGSFFNKKNSIK